jgi:hypothetical protein
VGPFGWYEKRKGFAFGHPHRNNNYHTPPQQLPPPQHTTTTTTTTYRPAGTCERLAQPPALRICTTHRSRSKTDHHHHRHPQTADHHLSGCKQVPPRHTYIRLQPGIQYVDKAKWGNPATKISTCILSRQIHTEAGPLGWQSNRQGKPSQAKPTGGSGEPSFFLDRQIPSNMIRPFFCPQPPPPRPFLVQTGVLQSSAKAHPASLHSPDTLKSC